MSWSIENLVNTVKVPKDAVDELFEAGEDDRIWYEKSTVLDKNGMLTFNPDHQEHMDYLSDSAITKILRKYKVKGDICFGSLEGDDAGSFWGYRFDGKGGMDTLEGKLQWYVTR